MYLPGPMTDDKLSDDQVWNRLHSAREALGEGKGVTVAGDTALTAARRALVMLQMGVLSSSEPDGQIKAPDENEREP